MSMIGSMLTCGFLLLVFRWSPILALKWTHRKSQRPVVDRDAFFCRPCHLLTKVRCSVPDTNSLTNKQTATKILVHSTDGQYTVVSMCKESTAPGGEIFLPRCFYFRNLRYFERPQRNTFTPMAFSTSQVAPFLTRPPIRTARFSSAMFAGLLRSSQHAQATPF